MAGPMGPAWWRLAVACAWLGVSMAQEGPRPQRVRNRLSDQAVGGQWVTNVGALCSICAVCLFVFYALQWLCAKMGICAPAVEEGHDEHNESSCGPGPQDGKAACPVSANPALTTTSPKPRCGSRPPVLTQARRSYARKLARMEYELEAFLREVRTRRCALGEVILAEPYPPSQEPGRLHVTVYEAADYGSVIQQ